MTRPMHQDATTSAAETFLRRTMVLLLLLLMFSLSSFPSVTAVCPDECSCNEELIVDCYEKGLDRIPDRIPPATKELDLRYNFNKDIEPKLFTHLTELVTLDLIWNDISELKNGAFSNLSKLQFLSLGANKIENIEIGVFNNLTSLESLLLSNSAIQKLDSEMFKGLTKLNSLELSENYIRELKNGAFSNLSKLQFLWLNENKIENIEIGVFNNLTSLNKLFLSGNQIHKLDLEMFKGLTKLSSLELYNNPLKCDCNILLFVNGLKKSFPEGTLELFGSCDPLFLYPVETQTKSLKEITENDLNCTPDVIVVPENITVLVGEQLQLSCKALGDPEPFITWAKDDIDLELGQRVQVLQNNTLIISKVERTDGGQYKCVASNSFGRKSFEAMVNVNGLAENGCNTMFGAIPGFFFIFIILANCLLYNVIL